MDCDALFDKTIKYDSYQSCYQEALYTANAMRSMFPESAGEVHCFDEKQIKIFEEFLEQGGTPSIDPEIAPEGAKSVLYLQ